MVVIRRMATRVAVRDTSKKNRNRSTRNDFQGVGGVIFRAGGRSNRRWHPRAVSSRRATPGRYHRDPVRPYASQNSRRSSSRGLTLSLGAPVGGQRACMLRCFTLPTVYPIRAFLPGWTRTSLSAYPSFHRSAQQSCDWFLTAKGRHRRESNPHLPNRSPVL